ncbi:hypothetical protein [Streptomyces sp. CT34]|uniref:hypothetical protein n=1 Tax=Streptomyces sp. CT34 TaxID=1553907 RepID=UPI000B28CE6A|nr:hypothetical protein [Streptomyces sp. CT34]
MSGTDVSAQPGEPEKPEQPGGPPRLRQGPPEEPAGAVTSAAALPPLLAVPPGASDTTRLLCAGTYLDEAFRDAVIDELYVHEERFAAPSLGIDAARVLAHALRARRSELGWAGWMLLAWIVALPLSRWLATAYVVPLVLLGLGRYVRRVPLPEWLARGLSFLFRWYGRLTLTLLVVGLAVVAFSGDGFATDFWSPFAWLLDNLFSGSSGSGSLGGGSAAGGYAGLGSAASGSDPSGFAAQFPVWVALLLPLLSAALVALRRGRFARVLARELSRERFPDVLSDPAEQSEGIRFQRLRHRVRTEQHGPLVMYRAANPFCGAGEAIKPWSLSVELVPRTDRVAEPLDNGAILARVVPLVEELRIPSGSPQTAPAVRDRLRALEIDECVFLPTEGLPTRAAAPYDPAAFEAHRAAAIEEGGETRRHFLRIRVGGWNEGVVTTVFVRVHTQGGMLMLEVAPHVLLPLRQLFQDADRIAHRYRHHDRFGTAVWALTHTPRAAGEAVLTLLRGLRTAWRLLTGGNGGALPEGPAVSVRELGSFGEASLFQDMDVARYLKAIQDRVAAGVITALRDAGYRTEEFEQRIVNVAEGGVYVESAQGAVGIGDHNTLVSNGDNTIQRDSAPQKGRPQRGNG